METEESELKWNQVQDALGNLPLKWVTIGEYIVVMNNKQDMIIGGEPYLALQLWLNIKSGKIISRIWDQTVSLGKIASVDEFSEVCLAHFKGRPCIGYPLSDPNSEQDFFVSQTPIPRKISRACAKLLSPGTASAVTSCPECFKLKPSAPNDEMDDIKAFTEDGCSSTAMMDLDTCINEMMFKGEGEEAYKHEIVKEEDKYSFSSADTASSDAKKKSALKTEEINETEMEERNSCSELGYYFSSRKERCVHTCDRCGKDFPTPSKLQRHNLTHTGERPFACDLCARGFTQLSHLKNHQKFSHNRNKDLRKEKKTLDFFCFFQIGLLSCFFL